MPVDLIEFPADEPERARRFWSLLPISVAEPDRPTCDPRTMTSLRTGARTVCPR
jgi:hypothetical protein